METTVLLRQLSCDHPQLNQAPQLRLTSPRTIYHGTDSAELSCEVTGHPPPLTVLWRISWLGEESQDLVSDYSSPARLRVNMTASNSSEVTVSCSASNLLGASTSNNVTLYVVGEC